MYTSLWFGKSIQHNSWFNATPLLQLNTAAHHSATYSMPDAAMLWLNPHYKTPWVSHV
jgi:hypothetical protein